MTLVGGLRVALPVGEAFRLFTAIGERDWVDGWHPHFPEPVEDDAAVGIVFYTVAHGEHVTWIVIDRDGDRQIRYARVAAHRDAGTVEVRLEPVNGHTEVTVTYRLTALSPDGDRWLRAFAAGYPEFLRSWETSIADSLR